MRHRRALVVPLALLLAACDFGFGGPEPIRISEIHYHPVGEASYEERHEFIELYNASDEPVAIGGWRLAGESVAFEFPRGGSYLEPGEYAVVAKDRAALAAVWGLETTKLFGDYTGELDNGDDRIQLIDDHGDEVDVVAYEDGFPWPIAADGMGASAKWLDPALLPLSAHQYKGHSLERVSMDVGPHLVENWAPSPLDGPTPGLPNASAAPEPLPVVLATLREAVGTDQQLTVSFSRAGTIASVEVEWFLDDLSRTDEATTRVALADVGERQYRTLLAGVPDRAIVRFRVYADRGAGMEIVSPRPSDPYRWHAVTTIAPVAGNTRAYQLEIAPGHWGQLWNNVAAGRDAGCTINPAWNDEVPAVLVVNGEVYDALVRFQGSRYQRSSGVPIPSWPYPGPTAGPTPPFVLSWHIDLPRYRRFEKKGTVTLSKNQQGCPGFDAAVGFDLFRSVGVPAPHTRYARVYVNGGYYHYMQEIERPGEEMLKAYGPVGDLFKSTGGAVDEGAYGVGDERVLPPACGLSSAERYALTYDRKTNNWAGNDDLVQLIEDLNAVRAMGPEAERAFFAERFDLEAMLNHMAVINWAVPFDDQFQNHFLYRKRNGQWILMPWDLDLDFGTWRGADASIYIGEEGDPDNRAGTWNVLKDAFLESYRPEFEQRIRAFVDGPLSPDTVAAAVDRVNASADWAEAAASPIGMVCDPAARVTSFKQFAIDRQAAVKARVP